MKKYIPYFVLGIAIAFSGFLMITQSIRLDESQSIWAATKPLTGIMEYTGSDVHVPLYFTLLHFWIQIFGTNIILLRSLSFIFYLLSIYLLYKVARESSNHELALTTICIFSLSPFILWYSGEARMYTLFTFSTSLNHLFFLRMYRSDFKTSKFGYFLSAVLGFYTHYFFVFMIATQGLFVISRAIKTRSEKERLLGLPKFFLKYVTLAGGAFLFLVPWLVYVLKLGKIGNSTPSIGKPSSYDLFQSLANFLFGFQSQTILAIVISLWPLIVVLLFLVFTRRKKSELSVLEYFAYTSFLPIIIIFLLSYIRPIFLSRYLIFITPSLFFILAWVLINYSKKISSLFVTGFFAFMLVLSVQQVVSAATPVKEDYEGVTQYVSTHARAQDIIAVTAPFTVYPIEYTYNGSARIDTIPQWNRFATGAIPTFSLTKLDAQMKEYRKIYQNVYIVLSYDQGYETDIIHFMDTHYKLLQKKQFSPAVQLREYKLRYD